MLTCLPTSSLVEAVASHSQGEANRTLPTANVTTVVALATPAMLAIRNKETPFLNANIVRDTVTPWIYVTPDLDIHLATQNTWANLAFPTRLELSEVAPLVVPLSTTLQEKEIEPYMEKNIRMGQLQYPVPTSHRPNSNN
ncbi:hypothetical protein glysoja_032260 [Glycine soja]|uniref:Uncharacterized protein n=1 Tax=Glycine soja TaxID=3848 RepID=A0A0B2QSI7_GLYSO|nr:hypothetical protein glysoja_032260 [Glycine soja]